MSLGFGFVFIFPSAVFAQGIMDNDVMGENNTVLQDNDNRHTDREEVEGRKIWKKLQAQELGCEDLSDDDFGALGEYYMGQMIGDSHEGMNNMMTQMMGEEGEKQMHVTMSKRLSRCDTSAAMPTSGMGFMPLMQMMTGGGMMSGGSNLFSLTNSSNNPMMNFGFTPFGWIGGIFMILFWVLVIVGVVSLIKWLASQNRYESNDARSALDVLKERYAKGEIDKKEFEEKKKDLS